MFKNVVFFHAGNIIPKSDLASLLAAREFSRCENRELVSVGFSPVIDNELVHQVGSHLILRLTIEKKLLPSGVVKEFVNDEIAKITEREGERPGRKRVKEIKERVIEQLTPKAFGVKKHFFIWIDPVAKLMCIDSSSRSVIDQFTKAFFACVHNDMQITPIATSISPSAAMAEWLTNGAPPEFSVDRDCLLKNPDSNASLRFSKHSLENAVDEHLREGKMPTELAMTWKNRVSFTLGADQSIKKLHLLDIITDDIEQIDDAVAAFNADVMLVTSELLCLIPDLVEAMGGEE